LRSFKIKLDGRYLDPLSPLEYSAISRSQKAGSLMFGIVTWKENNFRAPRFREGKMIACCMLLNNDSDGFSFDSLF